MQTRNKILLFLIIFYSSFSIALAAGSFNYSPEKPKTSEAVSVSFNPAGTALEEASEVTMFVYFYGIDLVKTEAYEMKKEGGVWSASFSADNEILGAAVKFASGETSVNNNGAGYFINYYNESGEMLPGSRAGTANALNSWGVYYMDINRDMEKALQLFEEELSMDAGLQSQYLNSYFTVLSRVRPQIKDSVISSRLQEVEKSNPESEKDLILLATWYSSIQNQEKADLYKNKLESAYPMGDYFANIKLGELYNEKDPVKKEELFNAFREKYTSSSLLPSAYSIYISFLRDKGEFVKAKDLAVSNKDLIPPYVFYSLANKIYDSENPDVNTAKQLAEAGVEAARNQLENPKDPRPAYQSESQWLKDREYLLAVNLYAYGKALYLEGNKDDAEEYLEEASEYSNNEESDIAELYAKLLIENGSSDDALELLEGILRSGKGTSGMKELIKTAYINENGEEGFGSYYAEIDAAAKEKVAADLKKQMKNDPAPDFTLTDMNGNNVSLAELKGKVVILDFWATWCGPCKVSFPGMQIAVNKYAENDNVKFLFINTWERVENKLQNAKDFISQNQYTFQVLMDYDNAVITKYKVSGIPTKFIIGKDGNIKFVSVGFSGNTDQMVEELSAMISMLE